MSLLRLNRPAALMLSLLAGSACAMSLSAPTDGVFLKSATSIAYQSTGVRLSTYPTVTLAAPSYSQVGWWYSYYGSNFTQTLTTPLPNNTWVTATLRDGIQTSSRKYWTAFFYAVPSSIASAAASSWYNTFPSGYCTNYASRAFHAGPSINASYIPWSGDAQRWISNAGSAGWKTTSSTTGGQIGAAIVWSGGSFGHVGVVVDMNKTSVAGEIEYTINEMNWGTLTNASQGITTNFGKVTTVKLKSSALNRSSGYPFIGFVLPQRT